MDQELIFDVLDDLSDELEIEDFYQFVMINDLAHILTYKIIRRVEYYYEMFKNVRLHEVSCGIEDECFCIPLRTITQYVCFAGDLDVVKWFYYNKREVFDKLMRERSSIACASAGGHLDIVKWLHENTTEVDDGPPSGRITSDGGDKAIEYACGNGYLEIAKWLKDNGYADKCTYVMISWAARFGYLDILKWIKQEYPDFKIPGVVTMDRVASNGFLNVIEWIYQYYPEATFSENVITMAYHNGHLEIIKWIHQNFPDIPFEEEYDVAFDNGHTEVVE